ncbi:MAG: hypothetical protein M0P94_01055 [Candidatus Absconditabacterales bacterium]|nr:hypothetical protein [Candidatus Absconditabacterales bacterium]
MNNIITTNLDEMTYEEFLNDDVYNIETYGDLSDGWEYVDSLIENLTKEPNPKEVPEEYVDQIVKDEDYMEFQGYIERISDDFELLEKVMDYIKFNYPEFFEDIQVAGNEKVITQKTGKNLTKTFPSVSGFEQGKQSPQQTIKKLNQTGTEIKDVLTW